MKAASAYTTYRASGLPWVPQLPEGWLVLRNGRLFGHRVEMGFPDLPILEVSLRTGVRVRDMENLKRKQVMSQKEKYKRAAKGDIAYNMMRMWQGAVGPAPVDGLVSPAYVVVKPYDEANSSYYSHLFRTAAYMQEVNKFSRGIVADRNRLYWESFKQMPSLAPPRPEQDQIVAYLRAQDAHIARFIQAKRDLIKLLTEQKLRIIDHAVTRGLDATFTLKPSGTEWLGEVPEHWEVQRLKNVANVVLGKMLTMEAKAGDGDFKSYMRSTNVQWIKPDVRDVKEMWVAKAEMAQLRVRKGDLLVSEGGEVGRACMWNDELPECYIQNSVHRVAAKPMMLPEFLFHQFFAYGKRGRFNAIVNRVSIAHLTREKLVTVPFTVPPIEEQKLICRWISDECQPLDDAITRTEDEIKLIREYRDRLIADVVTGQVDVRGWQPGPDDLVDDVVLAALGDVQEDVTEEEDGDGKD
ncbi:restriction endonuclease subunit S [Stenotrophomonas indicatrix]|uniref:restriction endonuclease subunit S n=1 Tax=Stenotrophomonas indicatrix TaxID=2045451 RepID=UPI0008B00A52|nr:restriction endonuclease subunit S [Stenotrophomonas indicatrix]SET83469.1 type I restriction enzyme, S subunit [Stenotrophomonas indicatrix]